MSVDGGHEGGRALQELRPSLEAAFETFRRSHATLRTLVSLDGSAHEVEYLDSRPGTGEGGEVVVMLPPLGGTAACFFRQLEFFERGKGRAVAISYPATCSSLLQLVSLLDLFLETLLPARQVHLLGAAALGGYLAQLFCQTRPARVSSLFLVNSSCDLPARGRGSLWRRCFLSHLVFSLFRRLLRHLSAALLPVCRCSAGHAALGSVWRPSQRRGALLCEGPLCGPVSGAPRRSAGAGGRTFAARPREIAREIQGMLFLLLLLFGVSFGLCVQDERMTVLEAFDDTVSTEQQKAQLGKHFPEATLAHVKRGGQLCFLANPDETNLHLQVHLRRTSRWP